MQLLKGLFALLFTVGITTMTVAQQTERLDITVEKPEITDAELEAFAALLPTVNAIQQQHQQQMLTAVQAADITVERFNRIAQIQQQGSQELSLSNEEETNFNTALSAVQGIQQAMTEALQDTIAASALTVSRFQAIGQAVNTDAALQQKVQQLMQAPTGEE